MEVEISISPQLKQKCPQMALGIIFCDVKNSEKNDGLWNEISSVSQQIRVQCTLDNIKTNANIMATRKIYSACGKEPGRYRPSAEALMRRIVKGDSLYQINTLVDLVNLVSLKTGYSIGGFDYRYVNGNIVAGIGMANELYTGIGRGVLNIENLPVLRDSLGGIGTPTSDEERTALRIETTRFLMVINGYTGKSFLQPAIDYSTRLLLKYAGASNIYSDIIE